MDLPRGKAAVLVHRLLEALDRLARGDNFLVIQVDVVGDALRPDLVIRLADPRRRLDAEPCRHAFVIKDVSAFPILHVGNEGRVVHKRSKAFFAEAKVERQFFE